MDLKSAQVLDEKVNRFGLLRLQFVCRLSERIEHAGRSPYSLYKHNEAEYYKVNKAFHTKTDLNFSQASK